MPASSKSVPLLVPLAVSLAYRRNGSLRGNVSFSPEADPAPAPAPAATPPAPAASKGYSYEQAARYVDREGRGDPIRAVQAAIRKADGWREKFTTLETSVAQTPKTPDGGKVLTKDQAAEFDAYVALGKPADLKTRLDAGDAAAASVAKATREQASTDAATALGWNGKALAELASLKGLDVIVKDQPVRQADGTMKSEKVAYFGVKDAAGKVTERLATEYVDAEAAIFKPSLLATDDSANTGNSGNTGNPPTGVTYTPQNGSLPPRNAPSIGNAVKRHESQLLTPSERAKLAKG